MKIMKRIAAAILVAASSAAAGAQTPAMVLLPSDSEARYTPAPASLPKGILISIVAGNPDRPGPFTLRLRIPANTTIAPHTHATAETVTVLSGAIVHDMGDTLVRGRGRQVVASGFVFLPQDMAHSLWTTGMAAEIQVNGTGPFGLHYINPKDDPSRL